MPVRPSHRLRLLRATWGLASVMLWIGCASPDPSESVVALPFDARDISDLDMDTALDVGVADAGDAFADRGLMNDADVDPHPDQGHADAAPPAECMSPQPLDALCDPEANCCADGLVCANFGGGGRCARRCDARDEDCGPQALCVPLSLQGGGRPVPGACLESAHCDVDAASVCGPNNTCTVLSNITLCTRAGEAQPGEACTVFAEEPVLCVPGASCILGTCWAACAADGACPGDARCVDYATRLGGDRFRFCHDGCDVFEQQGCAADSTCTVGDVAPVAGTDTREVLGMCIDRAQGMGIQNQPCAPSVGIDWGDCKGGHLCQRPTADAAPVCVGICDDVDRSLCTHGSLCVLDVFDVPMGLCAGECVVWPGPDDKRCAVDEICAYRHVGLNQAGDAVPGGRCEPRTNAPAAAVRAGQVCARDPVTGHHDCAQGHLCTALDPAAPPICVALCTLADDGAHGCPMQQGCVDVFDDGRIGICLEGFAK